MLVVDVVVVTAVEDQENRVVTKTTGGYAPQVTFTRYSPPTQFADPPATMLSE